MEDMKKTTKGLTPEQYLIAVKRLKDAVDAQKGKQGKRIDFDLTLKKIDLVRQGYAPKNVLNILGGGTWNFYKYIDKEWIIFLKPQTKRYPLEDKIKACKLVIDNNWSHTQAAIATGCTTDTLIKWVMQYKLGHFDAK